MIAKEKYETDRHERWIHGKTDRRTDKLIKRQRDIQNDWLNDRLPVLLCACPTRSPRPRRYRLLPKGAKSVVRLIVTTSSCSEVTVLSFASAASRRFTVGKFLSFAFVERSVCVQPFVGESLSSFSLFSRRHILKIQTFIHDSNN